VLALVLVLVLVEPPPPVLSGAGPSHPDVSGRPMKRRKHEKHEMRECARMGSPGKVARDYRGIVGDVRAQEMEYLMWTTPLGPGHGPSMLISWPRLTVNRW
jgi:hypothetical protein